MRTLVGFRTGEGCYCVPVESTVAVRTAAGMVPLPDPRVGVAGLLPADVPLTVLRVLGSGSGHVLVLLASGQTFGLLVEEVTGLMRIEDDQIGGAPPGQTDVLVTGVITGVHGLIFVVDAAVLAKRLTS